MSLPLIASTLASQVRTDCDIRAEVPRVAERIGFAGFATSFHGILSPVK
jgi:hypothetical protein